MWNGDLTYNDYLQRLSIQDVLIDAGYHLNRRDGMRYPSYVRTDSDGRRVRGDKYIVTANGQCCFQPPRQKLYNVISFIKEHPNLFTDYRAGMSTDRLVNLVCNRLLNNPMPERSTRIVEPRAATKPFDISNYDILRYDGQNRNGQDELAERGVGGSQKNTSEFDDFRKFARPFYFYFKARGIDLYTQYAFRNHFCLATKHREDGLKFANLAFPLTKPGESKIVGLEERGRPRLDGSSAYKGKAEGSNGSEGLWIANLKNEPLETVGGVAWFESGYDAMAFYQLHRKAIRQHPDLDRKGIYVSTGGSPTVGQIKGMLRATPQAHHFLCFDNDKAGREFVEMFKRIAEELHINPENVKVMPLPVWCKDWNDLLLNKTSEEYLKSIEGEFEPLGMPKGGTEVMGNQGNEEQRNLGNSEEGRLENQGARALGR